MTTLIDPGFEADDGLMTDMVMVTMMASKTEMTQSIITPIIRIEIIFFSIAFTIQVATMISTLPLV